MSFVKESDLLEFKKFCEDRNINPTFANYIVWKDKYRE